jgi:hypothetical protein
MKIPKDMIDRVGSQRIKDIWVKAADDLSMEHGIFIQANWSVTNGLCLDKIWFEVMGHKFESLMDLRKALNNKAFL